MTDSPILVVSLICSFHTMGRGSEIIITSITICEMAIASQNSKVEAQSRLGVLLQ